MTFHAVILYCVRYNFHKIRISSYESWIEKIEKYVKGGRENLNISVKIPISLIFFNLKKKKSVEYQRLWGQQKDSQLTLGQTRPRSFHLNCNGYGEMRITPEMYFKLYVNIEWNNVKCFIFLLPISSDPLVVNIVTVIVDYNLVFIYGQRQQNMLRVRTTIAWTYMCHSTRMNST